MAKTIMNASQSAEVIKVTKTIKSNGNKPKSTVVVPPHTRNVGGKIIQVAGYSYKKRA